MKRVLLFLLGAFFFLQGIDSLRAQKYSNEFLNIGISARAQAMGNAVIASTSDVTAGYWNPAGLAAIPADAGLQVGAMHAEWFAGIGKYDYLGLAIPFANGKRRLGLSVIRFGIDGIPNTLSLFDDEGNVNYDNIVEFSAADYAVLAGLGQQTSWLGGNLSLGGNIKIVHRVIGTFANSWGFGLDLAARLEKGPWRLGIVGRDITSTFNAWTVSFTEEEKTVLLNTGNELPDISSLEVSRPQLLLGAGYLFEKGKVTIQPEISLYVTTDGRRNTLVSGDPFSIDPSAGLELGYNQFVFVRAGVNQFQQELSFDKGEFWSARPSIGVGLKLGIFTVDYAYTDLGDSQNRYSHVVSLMANLKPRGGR